MSENRENNEKVTANPDWTGFENWLASEIISGQGKISKAKDIGLVCGTVIACVVIGGLLAINQANTQVMYKNDSEWRTTIEQNNQRWIDYISEYDFITQDGEGINNINSGEQGDLNNESKGKIEEETGDS